MDIVVKISRDNMEAIVEVEGPGDEPLNVDAINRALAAAGVRHGIDEKGCHELGALVKDMPPGGRTRHAVAHGTPPLDGEDGNMEMRVEYTRNTVGLRDESDSIDFRDRGSFRDGFLAASCWHRSGSRWVWRDT